jgi:hypothetical protein
VDKARAALAVSDACPDAHVLLALYDAASLDEALQHYRTAEACAPAALRAGDHLVDTLQSVPVRAYGPRTHSHPAVVCERVWSVAAAPRTRAQARVLAMAGVRRWAWWLVHRRLRRPICFMRVN